MPSMTPSGLVQRWSAYQTQWNLRFQENLQAIPTFWQRFASLVPSGAKKEAYIWMDRVGQMRKWVDERAFLNPAVRYQELENDLFELSLNVKRTEIEDDTLGVYNNIPAEFAEAAKKWPDIQVSAALQAGASTVGYDGQNQFDDGHPIDPDNAAKAFGGYTVQVNNFTGAASGNQPGALPFSGPSVATAFQTMASWVGPDLVPMNIVPDLVVVPPQLKFAAKEVLDVGSELIIKQLALTSGYGAAAPTNVLKGTLDYIVNPYLANEPTTWYMLCTTRATKPLVWQLRESPEQVFFTRPTDTDVFLHDTFKYGIRGRGVAGFAQWFLAARCAAT